MDYLAIPCNQDDADACNNNRSKNEPYQNCSECINTACNGICRYGTYVNDHHITTRLYKPVQSDSESRRPMPAFQQMLIALDDKSDLILDDHFNYESRWNAISSEFAWIKSGLECARDAERDHDPFLPEWVNMSASNLRSGMLRLRDEFHIPETDLAGMEEMATELESWLDDHGHAPELRPR